MFSVGKCDNLTVVLLSDVLDNEAELPDHCTPPGPLPLLAGPHLILVLQVTTHRQLALLSVTSLSPHLAVVFRQNCPAPRPVDVRRGVRRDVAGDGEVPLLQRRVVLSSPLPHRHYGRIWTTGTVSGCLSSGCGMMFAHRGTKYHQKLSNKSQLRYGSVFSNKRNMPASQQD